MSDLLTPYLSTRSGKRCVVYYTNWSCYARKYQVKDIPIKTVTDIAYAFFNVQEDGTVISGDAWADFDNPYIGTGLDPQNNWNGKQDRFGNLGEFRKLKDKGALFNLILSVGGWTWSKTFSKAVSSSASRDRFVSSLRSIFAKRPGIFSGLSLDWEYLSDDGVNYGNAGNGANKADADNFIELLKLLRKNFPSLNLQMCVAADKDKVKFPVEKVTQWVDQYHVMTYDFHGFGETVASHHTNLMPSHIAAYSADEAVNYFLSRGVPPAKIFIGAAFYSRGFANCDGLGKACSGASPDQTWEPGMVDYKKLPVNGANELWDEEAQAAYSYDSKRRVLNSYDTPRSVGAKCDYINRRGLGGLLVWELSADVPDPASPRNLMSVISKALDTSMVASSIISFPTLERYK